MLATYFKQKIYHHQICSSTISFSLILFSFQSVTSKQSSEIYLFLQRKYVSIETVKDLPITIILLLVNFTRLNPLFATEVNKKVSYNNHKDIGHLLLTHPLSHLLHTIISTLINFSEVLMYRLFLLCVHIPV